MTTTEVGYDGDTANPDQYCKHGTFTGSWWGPDYLCGWCEDGVSLEDFQRYQREDAAHELREAVNRAYRLWWCMAVVNVAPPG